jgi:hypothetical protein
MLTGENLEVNHLRIFGFPAYVNVPGDKRSKLDSSRKKGIFVGYSETSKAYRVYILDRYHIETRRDVTFDEDATFNRSRQKCPDEIHEEEPIDPMIADAEGDKDIVQPECDQEYHDMVKPRRLEDAPQEKTRKRRPSRAHEIIQDVEKYGAPDGTFRERKRPKPYSSYMALLSDIIDVEPTCYEEVAGKKEWKDAMVEEYQSIVKNDVWDVVPRPKYKTVVSSKWIYKTHHSTDGSIEK